MEEIACEAGNTDDVELGAAGGYSAGTQALSGG